LIFRTGAITWVIVKALFSEAFTIIFQVVSSGLNELTLQTSGVTQLIWCIN